ncbi:MAG: phosphoribosylaminoimidazole-succinocarboxamide synthase [Armatimonadota bacterium]|nr:MAG: phosphoribosylaminoimidazole-succinocarboxamide synthase [Armatimonadota bacterium]
MQTVTYTRIPGLPEPKRGKVRDIYDLGDKLLIVATDRISAFDVVLPNGIPDKGRVLTQLSLYWFERTQHIVPNHLVSADIDAIAEAVASAGAQVDADVREMLDGRSMLVVKAKPYPIECVVRGYLAGSLWKEYVQAGGREKPVTLHGIPLPAGLRESDRLEEPIFTPATKAEVGHDENISLEQAVQIAGEVVRELARLSVEIYRFAREDAVQKGIIIADTKFEFGEKEGRILLIDEVLTPDSSRFWAVDDYVPGRSQPSFDKQYVRDWLESTGWDKTPPAPTLPDEVVAKTSEKYREAYRRITGKTL